MIQILPQNLHKASYLAIIDAPVFSSLHIYNIVASQKDVVLSFYVRHRLQNWTQWGTVTSILKIISSWKFILVEIIHRRSSQFLGPVIYDFYELFTFMSYSHFPETNIFFYLHTAKRKYAEKLFLLCLCAVWICFILCSYRFLTDLQQILCSSLDPNSMFGMINQEKATELI